MLVGAGVNVVMTRTGDTRVNRKSVDWTRDGEVGYRDELSSRIEIANAPAPTCSSSSTTTAPTGRGCHRDLVRPHAPVRGGQQEPGAPRPGQPGQVPEDAGGIGLETDRPGHPSGPVLRASLVQDPLPRASQRDARDPRRIPGDGPPYERWLLRVPRGKQAIAAGYYAALARFFATRQWARDTSSWRARARRLSKGRPIRPRSG